MLLEPFLQKQIGIPAKRDHCQLYCNDLNVSQVANLSWLERSVARSLFAEPPTATFPEAVEHFMKAERLSPIPWKENRLLLAKCHISQSCYADAVMWLDRAAGVPVTTPDVSHVVHTIMLQALV